MRISRNARAVHGCPLALAAAYIWPLPICGGTAHTPRQEGGDTITVDLGTPQRLGALEIWFGAYPGQFPRRLSIDVSGDGASWTTVYTGGTALHTYDAAVRSPGGVPLTFMIHRDAVRLLRLRQTAADSHGWSIVALRVLR